MSDFDFGDGINEVIDELDRLAREVPEAVPKALNAMSNILIPALKEAAPYDDENTDGEHLKDAIGKTNTRISKAGNKYQLVFIKNRGLKDRNVLKALAAEYGRRPYVNKNGKSIPMLPPNRFWSKTVLANKERMLEAGREIMEEAVEKAKKK